LGAAKEFGTVSVGSRADLILVEGNPLEDVSRVSKQTGVMIGGRWLGQTDVRKNLDEIAASFAR
jgi:imidazolonepropionase-like amidohydrolase